jgi:hypothetical protein
MVVDASETHYEGRAEGFKREGSAEQNRGVDEVSDAF